MNFYKTFVDNTIKQGLKKAVRKNKQQLYYKSPKGYKTRKRCAWRSNGLNMDTFEEVFDRHLNTTHCELCSCLLTIDRYNTDTTKCMDHNHLTGEFRFICCHRCNVDIGSHYDNLAKNHLDRQAAWAHQTI